ncbi:hypothetical protein TTHERM_00543650 (macronuclear) [Tetrahymena thermophila SB210]|uniref:Transmembrane protein n=1 Tax=Tetrahymena thermophila (strain SB210) TaxID=312017 RepID=I7LTR8_TETTS|nr:hypothetical protein TTHERM_00543650 [Tetrahymena thermophila SB210]EAR86025.2 hypothetical protein TTHERM_00543650 [Tetrahymena thermophila SB210]|eukprot:XP_976620.2 hypothetical protein TTHERM_00543650 [Tetrahymena thermophila SB210]
MILQFLITFFLLFSTGKLECSHNILEADELHLYSQVQSLELPNTLMRCDESIHICFIYSSMNLTLNLYDFFRFEIIQSVPIEEKYVKEIHIQKHEEQLFIILESEQNELLVYTFDFQIQNFSTYQKLNDFDLQVPLTHNTTTAFQQVNQTNKVESNVRNLRDETKIDKKIEQPFIFLNLLIKNKGLNDKKSFYLIKIRLSLSKSNQNILQGQNQQQKNNKTITKYHDIDLSRFEIRPKDSSLHFINCSLLNDQSYVICVDNTLKVGFLDLRSLETPVFQKQKNSVRYHLPEIPTFNYHKLFQANKLEINFQLQGIVLSKQESLSIVLIYQSIQKKVIVFDQLVFDLDQQTFTSLSRHVVQNMNQDILISKLFQNQTSLKESQTQLKNCLFDFNETQFKEKKQNKTNAVFKQKNISQLLFSKADSKQIRGFFISDGQKIQFFIKNCLYQNEYFVYPIFDCQKNIECDEYRNFNNQEICFTEKSKNSGKLYTQKDNQKKQLKLIKRINIRYQTSLNLEEFIEQNKSEIVFFLLLLICVGCLCQENIQECIKSQKNKYCKDQSDLSQYNGTVDQPQPKTNNAIQFEQKFSIEKQDDQSEYFVVQPRQIANNKNMSSFSSDIENYSLEDLYMERNFSTNKLQVQNNNYPIFENKSAQLNEIISNAQIQKKYVQQQTQSDQEDQEEEKQQCYSQFKDIQEFQYKQEYCIDQFRQFQKNNQILKSFQIPAFEIEKDNKNYQKDFFFKFKNPPQNQYKGVSHNNSNFLLQSSKQIQAEMQEPNSRQQTEVFDDHQQQSSEPSLQKKYKDFQYTNSQTLKGAFNYEAVNDKNSRQPQENIFNSCTAESITIPLTNDQQFVEEQNNLNESNIQLKDKLSNRFIKKNNFEINKFQNQNNQILEQQHQNALKQIYFQFNDKEFIVPSDNLYNSPCNFQLKQSRQNTYDQDILQQQDQQYCKAPNANQLQLQDFISTQSIELRLLQKYKQLSSQSQIMQNNNIQPLRDQTRAIPFTTFQDRGDSDVGAKERANYILQDGVQQQDIFLDSSTMEEIAQGQNQFCSKGNQKEQKYRLQFKNIQDEKATKQQYQNMKLQNKESNQRKGSNEECYLQFYSPHTNKQFKKCMLKKFRQELDWFTQSSFYCLTPHTNSVLQKKTNSQNQKFFCKCDPQQQIQKINQRKCGFCLYAHNIKIYNQLNYDQKKQNLQKSQFFFNCKNNCNSRTLSTQSNNIHKSASSRLQKANQTQQKLLKNQVESPQISNNIHSYQSQQSQSSQDKPSAQDREQMWHLTFQQQSVNFEEEILNQMELSGSASSQSNSSILTSDFQSQRFMDNFQEQMGDCVNQEGKYDPFFYTSETNDKSFFSSTSNEYGDTVKKIRHINNDLKQQEIFDIKDFQFISENLFEESQEVKKQKDMNHILFNNNLNASDIFDKNDQIDTLQKMTQQISNHFLLSINNLLNESKNI